MLLAGLKEKYPEKILEKREFFEGQVIGLIAKDLLLLDECNLEISDFKSEEGRLFFKIEEEIRKKGYNVLDEVTVISNISDNLQEKFEEYGGYDSIQALADVVSLNNTESILDALHRENTIMRLYDSGFNSLKPCIDDKGKEYIPLEKFRKMTSENVRDWYEVQLNKSAIGYNTKILEEKKLLATSDWLDKVYAGEKNGIPFEIAGINTKGEEEHVYSYLSKQLKGLLRGSSTFCAAYSSVGKTSYITGIIISLITQGEKVLIFSNEQDSDVFLINMLIWLAYKHFGYMKITKSKMSTGQLTDEEKKQLEEIVGYYNENYAQNVQFIHLPDMDIATIKSKTRYYSLKEGFSVVVVDTFKMDYSTGAADASYHKLIQDTRLVDSLAKQLDLIGLFTFQLAPSTLGKLFLDVTCLSGAKAVKDTAENLLLMRVVYPEELIKGTSIYCNPYRKKSRIVGENGNKKMQWYTEPFDVDSSKTYRMMFVDKCRAGQNSSDSGEAMLLEFDPHHVVFKEVAYCKPKRMVI